MGASSDLTPSTETNSPAKYIDSLAAKNVNSKKPRPLTCPNPVWVTNKAQNHVAIKGIPIKKSLNGTRTIPIRIVLIQNDVGKLGRYSNTLTPTSSFSGILASDVSLAMISLILRKYFHKLLRGIMVKDLCSAWELGFTKNQKMFDLQIGLIQQVQ